jgi:3'(2'), 5'-bisphosphate nucleotidase
MTEALPQHWIEALVLIVEDAGAAIMEVYNSNFEVQTKSDESPLTQADLAAHQVIVRGLQALSPQLPIISEESTPPEFAERSSWHRYWLVDPLDGTKEFVNRNGEFTVNIALIDAHQPVFGIVGVPVQGKIYIGDTGQTNPAQRAYVLQDGISSPLSGPTEADRQESLRIVASRNHGGQRLEDYLSDIAARFENCQRRPVGSSLKLCVLAEGGADIYPRLGPTSEWDIGAAQAVLTAAGGAVYTPSGQILQYNTKESLLNPEFLAVGDASHPWRDRLPAFPE